MIWNNWNHRNHHRGRTRNTSRRWLTMIQHCNSVGTNDMIDCLDSRRRYRRRFESTRPVDCRGESFQRWSIDSRSRKNSAVGRNGRNLEVIRKAHRMPGRNWFVDRWHLVWWMRKRKARAAARRKSPVQRKCKIMAISPPTITTTSTKTCFR